MDDLRNIRNFCARQKCWLPSSDKTAEACCIYTLSDYFQIYPFRSICSKVRVRLNKPVDESPLQLAGPSTEVSAPAGPCASVVRVRPAHPGQQDVASGFFFLS